MKLYYIPSSCSLSPHIVINELGMDVELARVDNLDHMTASGHDFYKSIRTAMSLLWNWTTG